MKNTIKSQSNDMKNKIKLTIYLIAFSCWVVNVIPSFGQIPVKKQPLVIQDQGSFAVGGTIIENTGIYGPVKTWFKKF